MMRLRLLLIGAVIFSLPACVSMVTSAASGLAGNLNAAILNQDDPHLVRDGAPAYLLMLDSFVEGAPENEAVLRAAAELYSAYGVVFIDNPERARKLTTRGRDYGQRALCAAEDTLCGIWALPYEPFMEALSGAQVKQMPALYTFALSWLAWIQAHSDDYSALAKLPQVQAALHRVQTLDARYEEARIEHYLAVLNTIRPPALGGDFERGRAHYERALEVSGNLDLGIKVDYARYYARTLYDRELHDRLLEDVLAADPEQTGLTLFNTLAQEEARELLDSADDYF
ncbi:MAG: TRAP transporter TatT component family protein [Lysobacterales bacterium]